MATNNRGGLAFGPVANSHEEDVSCDGSAVRTALDAGEDWENAPSVSGAELARALGRVGCDVRLSGPEHVSLFRDGVEVARLALNASVRAATLRAVLRSFGISVEELAAHLTDPTHRHDP